MSSLFNSFVKGSKWIGANVLPILGLASGSGELAAAGLAARQEFKSPSAGPALPPPVPLPDDQSVQSARRKSAALQASRSSRASTVLSPGNGDTLGGG